MPFMFTPTDIDVQSIVFGDESWHSRDIEVRPKNAWGGKGWHLKTTENERY